MGVRTQVLQEGVGAVRRSEHPGGPRSVALLPKKGGRPKLKSSQHTLSSLAAPPPPLLHMSLGRNGSTMWKWEAQNQSTLRSTGRLP